MTQHEETLEFRSEAQQLLDLMIHSVYSNKEVFLRELISNASDALDKRRLESITDKSLLEDGAELGIRIESDTEQRTLTVSDTGIGMSRTEMVENLGTIARSGTKAFIEKMKKETDAGSLIGQFGVGFYASFMVADRVSVVSRRADEDTATEWTSTGGAEFTVKDGERDAAGTTVTLHLRDVDAENGIEDFTAEWGIERLIKKYSDFVTYPIQLHKEKDGETEWQTVNSMKAIWARPESEVEDAEYAEFYRHVGQGFDEPAERIRLQAEGTFEYQALLFIPSSRPFDLFWREGQWGLQLYVNRVLIKERCEDLIPQYLRFLRGVVDSPDLSLNVSREMLQNDRRVAQIKKRIAKKTLEALAHMQSEDEAKYKGFFENFGTLLKEGVIQEKDQQEPLLNLLLFPSSNGETETTTLKDYVSRMKEGQEQIYFIAAESLDIAKKSPHLEALFARDYEVLFFVDTIDELLAENVREFDGKTLQSVGKGQFELGTEDERKKAEEERVEEEKKHETLLKAIQDAVEEDVKQVRLSTRLTGSAACLVSDQDDVSPQLQRMLEQAGQQAPTSKRILELNPKHPLMDKLNRLHLADQDEQLRGYAQVIYGQALLAEGQPLPDPTAFNELVTDVMVRAE